MKALWILLSFVLLSTSAAFGQQVQEKKPLHPPGGKSPEPAGPLSDVMRIRGSVYTGEPAPDFELPASTGHPMRLSSLRDHWVLLVFSERKEGLAPLASIVDPMKKMDVTITGVCDEKAYNLVAFVEKGGPAFPMLADVTHEISALYGLYDPVRDKVEPGFFVIDREGIVRLALLGQQLRPADIGSLVRYAVKGL